MTDKKRMFKVSGSRCVSGSTTLNASLTQSFTGCLLQQKCNCLESLGISQLWSNACSSPRHRLQQCHHLGEPRRRFQQSHHVILNSQHILDSYEFPTLGRTKENWRKYVLNTLQYQVCCRGQILASKCDRLPPGPSACSARFGAVSSVSGPWPRSQSRRASSGGSCTACHSKSCSPWPLWRMLSSSALLLMQSFQHSFGKTSQTKSG
mmetsp:Transcript_23040/g.44789  ORF Transcript_23040/g.44789 Transcript_23040/m.44789 type:complete len:207 (-) Transcript_23040:1131-1751(-)